jgi:hypothetical protein
MKHPGLPGCTPPPPILEEQAGALNRQAWPRRGHAQAE